MRRALFTSPATRLFNTGAAKLLDVPVVGRLLGRGMTVVRYTGRRSGNVIELPVGYRRSGEHLNIAVMMPDAKTWSP